MDFENVDHMEEGHGLDTEAGYITSLSFYAKIVTNFDEVHIHVGMPNRSLIFWKAKIT